MRKYLDIQYGILFSGIIKYLEYATRDSWGTDIDLCICTNHVSLLDGFRWIHISRVSFQKGLTRHAYAWQIGPFWQDTLDIGVIAVPVSLIDRVLTPTLLGNYAEIKHSTTLHLLHIIRKLSLTTVGIANKGGHVKFTNLCKLAETFRK